MNNRKIVIVDDDKHLLKFLEFTLSQAGYEAVPRESANELKKTLDKEEPALLILDVLMPGMDGFTVAADVRANEKYNDMKIIVCSAIYKKEKYEEEAKKIGVNAYLRKPIEKEVLISTVESIIGPA